MSNRYIDVAKKKKKKTVIFIVYKNYNQKLVEAPSYHPVLPSVLLDGR